MKANLENPNSELPTEKLVYKARPLRDRSVTAIPGILWKAKKDFDIETEVVFDDTESLHAKMLELYALATEYSLEPVSVSAVERSQHINAVADINDTNDEKFLKSLEALFIENEKPENEEQSESSLKEEISNHRKHIKESILRLMSNKQIRERYLAEISAEKTIIKSPEAKQKLSEILKTRALKYRLLEERRHLRVEEFLSREGGAGKPRPKSVGRTPEALQKIERGAKLAEFKEGELLKKLDSPQRGLLATELLLQRKRELEEKGFVLSPSREKLISEIVELTSQGYRVFLGGPTGTGKTSIALFALKEMTNGSFSWVTWTGETSVRDLFGYPKISTNAEGNIESGMTKGPVARAFLGEKRGTLHEEFTTGQTGVQMSMKTLWASKPGEQINLPGFNGTEFTKSELIEIATGNLKGKRHQERENMDPAVAREFKAIEVPFMSSDETRDYLILPMLIDRSGIMPLDRREINMITQFCRAAELSQLAYLEEIPQEVRGSDFYKIISPSGEPIVLTNVFLDTGTVKDLFSGWRSSGKPLGVYLQEGLRRFIEQNPYFKENKIEQETLRKILQAYGFNLDANNDEEFYSQGSVKKTTPYTRPSEMGFLLSGASPSEEDEYNDSGDGIETGPDDFSGVESRIQALLLLLESEKKEGGGFTYEQYLASIHPFLRKTYKDNWEYTQNQLNKVNEVALDPKNIHIGESIPFDTLRAQNASPDPNKTGEIYLSGETPDFENAKVFIPEIPAEIARQGISGVMKYIYETYNKTHIIPDIKYWKYLIELGDKYQAESDEAKKQAILDKIPEQLRDTGLYYFFTGSAFVVKSGSWMCPVSNWYGAELNRAAHSLDRGWSANCRVVLLER